MKNKVFVPDTGCVFFRATDDWHDAPVYCTKKEIETGACVTCGFNPAVKQKRLAEKVGQSTAEQLCLYSESLNRKGSSDEG